MSPHLLRLDGELTIYRAAELKETLLAAVREHPAVEVDLSGVTEFDTAGVQLLLLAKREALAAQRSLTLTRHSPAVVEVFELLDLVGHFGDPIALSV
ncbi:MAG: lipid asymmetry maintenance protein MlaB [Rhizobacter sp.]|jgi:anti-sigma B factor antagonist